MKNIEFNINDYTTKTRKMADKDYFRWAHNYPFVHLLCTSTGILLTGTQDYRVGKDGGASTSQKSRENPYTRCCKRSVRTSFKAAI